MNNGNSTNYYIFGTAIVLFQFMGYNPLSLSLLALAAFLLASFGELERMSRIMPWFLLFLLSSLVIGLLHLINEPATPRSYAVWGQFYFLAFLLLCTKDKNRLLLVLRTAVYLICIADVLTNLMLAAGVHLPWSELPVIRPGELLPRYPGVKNSALYSGSISFVAICFLLEDKFRNPKLKKIALLLVIINLFLGGSYRYYITLMLLLFIKLCKIYNKRFWLFSTYFASIAGVIVLTFLTKSFSGSNYMRWKLWNIAIGKFADNMAWGTGFFSPLVETKREWSLRTLINAGVTESTILLIGICFGLIVLGIFIVSMLSTLNKYRFYSRYEAELGLFFGLSLDMFWGGSIDNSLSLSVFLLSFYCINSDTSISKFVGQNKDTANDILHYHPHIQ